LFQSVYSTGDNFINKNLPRVKNFYNLYHPADLIAYRIEPLLKCRKEDPDPDHVLPPVLVPYYMNSGFNGTQKLI